MKIINSEKFSYGFHPNFPYVWAKFWKDFVESPSRGLTILKSDPVLFVEMCCQTVSKDPVTGLLSIMKLELFEAQKEYIRSLQQVFVKRQALVLLKSRQIGASWLTCAFSLWVAIFHPHQVVLFTTKSKEDLYIEDDPMTLMGKVKYMLDKLPKVFKKNAIYYEYCIARQFKINDCILKGLTGKEAGRSQTASLTINDEFDFNQNQKALLSSMKNACDTNIFLSTLNSPNSEFDRMRKSSAYVQCRIHWRTDPRIKDQEKFKADYIAKNGIGDFDREMDMKFNQGSKKYIIDHDWIEKMKEKEVPIADYTGYPLVAALDVAAMGGNMNVLTVKQGWKFWIYSWNKTPAYESYDILMEYYETHKWQILVFDEIGVGYAIAGEFERNYDQTPFEVVGINVGSTGQDKKGDIYDELLEEESHKVYANLRARLYWEFRERFRRTVEGTATYYELIYVDDDRVLEEAYILTFEDHTGKIKVISKKDLPPGIKSPDYLDSSVYTLYAEELIMDDLVNEEIYR